MPAKRTRANGASSSKLPRHLFDEPRGEPFYVDLISWSSIDPKIRQKREEQRRNEIEDLMQLQGWELPEPPRARLRPISSSSEDDQVVASPLPQHPAISRATLSLAERGSSSRDASLELSLPVTRKPKSAVPDSSGIENSSFHQLSIATNQASRSSESPKAFNGNRAGEISEHREVSPRSSRTLILLEERGSPELQAAGPSRARSAAARQTAGAGDGGEADSESDGGEIRATVKNGKPRRPSPPSKPKASAPSEKKRPDRVSTSPKGKEKRKEDGNAKAVSASKDKHTKEKRRRKRKHSSDEDEEDEVKHLKSNLNADAFAKSSGTNSRSTFSAKLKKFKQARTGQAVDSSASSSEDSDSDSSISSSSSSFIAKDDEVELEDGKRVKSKSLAPPLQPPRFHDTLPAFQRNMDLDAACSLYIRWLVLTIVEQLPTKGNDLAEMEAARKRLQQHAEDSRQIISSAALRRQFTFYLAKYPKLERLNLSNLSKSQTHTGCAACHRSKQLCTDRLTFSGPLYHDKDLNRYGSSSDEELSSDMSTDAEDQMSHEAKEPRKPVKGEGARKRSDFHICYAGPHCADRAMILHKISHWEYNMLQSVNRSQPMKDLRQLQKPSKNRTVRDGEVNRIVNAKKGELKTLMATLRAQATKVSRAT